MRIITLVLVLALLVVPAGATEFDDIMQQLDETGTYDLALDDYEWTEADTTDVNSPYYLGEETEPDTTYESSPVSEKTAEAADDAADEVAAEELPADLSLLVSVLSGMLFFMGVTAGLLFIHMLFERVRVV